MDYLNLVKAVIAKRMQVPVPQIGDDTELASLAVESFTLIEFLIDLQERYGIHLVADDLRELRTVRDLGLLVEQRVKACPTRSVQRIRAALF